MRTYGGILFTYFLIQNVPLVIISTIMMRATAQTRVSIMPKRKKKKNVQLYTFNTTF